MHPFLNIADRAARQAGKIILNGLSRLDRIQSSIKGEQGSIVTEIDLRAEQAIVDIIQEAYPQHSILAEEGSRINGTGYLWIIDPLDGSSNFMHDFPHFAVSIAIKNQEKAQIDCALIYDPVRQETFSATRGQGAFLNNTQRFTRRLRVSKSAVIEESLLGISIPTQRSVKNSTPLNKEGLRRIMAQANGVRRTGSAALDLAYVAAGRLDAALAMHLKPWDIAAGILLIQEAGGINCDFKGGEDYLESGHLISANSKLCRLLLKEIHQT